LVAGIDVGKYEALCLIADHRGEIVGDALVFPLTQPGALLVEQQLQDATKHPRALSVRIGVETAGHYHRLVVSRLAAAGHDVVELNPAHAKAVSSQQGSAASRSIYGMPQPSSSW
jgi:transposase